MMSLAFFIVASPEFGDPTPSQSILILLWLIVIPVFALALCGPWTTPMSIWGVCQIIALISTGAVQWRLTRRSRWAVKVTSTIITYLVTNIVFTAIALYPLLRSVWESK